MTKDVQKDKLRDMAGGSSLLNLRTDIGQPLEEEFGILGPIPWSPEPIDFDKNCKECCETQNVPIVP